MTWFKVDDSFYDHPKVFDAPDSALALWTRAGCWSARNLTDGFVPASLPARLCDDPDTAVRVLVDRGLWKRIKGGYRFHDWGVYQPSAADVRDLRAKRAAAGRSGGQAKAAKHAGSKRQGFASDLSARKTPSHGVLLDESAIVDASQGRAEDSGTGPADTRADQGTRSNSSSKPLASASRVAKQNAAPSRPDPSRRDGGSVGESSTGRNTRTNDDDHDPIIQTVIGVLADETGREVTPEHAAKVAAGILNGRAVDQPARYVSSAIRGNPRQFLPSDSSPASTPVHEARRAAGATGPGTDPNDTFRTERERLRQGGRPA